MTHSALHKFLQVTFTVTCALSLVGTMHHANAAEERVDDAADGLTSEEIFEVYKARDLGMNLYAEKKYDEAFPQLMIAATHGLKKAQAQVGVMHLHGLGNVKKDTRFAFGWIGVAAEGRSEREIEKYFKDLWKQIPKEHKASYETVVDRFIEIYGTDATNVDCVHVNAPGSQIRQLQCMLTNSDGRAVSDALRDAARDAEIGGGIGGIGGTPTGGPSGP